MTDSTLSLHRVSADSSSGDQSWLTSLADWTVSLMEVIGPVGAGIAIALENLFPPLPSEVVLPMAGLTASRGSFTLFEALLWTTLGSVVGAFALYGLGRWLGVDRLRAIAAKVPLLHPEDVDRTVAWFERHGGKAARAAGEVSGRTKRDGAARSRACVGAPPRAPALLPLRTALERAHAARGGR